MDQEEKKDEELLLIDEQSIEVADSTLPSEQEEYSPKYGHLNEMYRRWFLDYASYVILERAVPHIDDGLKPVQRRILHNMKIQENGRLIKVQNIAGTTMQYHPHGDMSIKDALVQLGQKGFLIRTQGNWGNIFTGDSAAAGRYIEAKLSDFALESMFGNDLTEWKANYDGTLKEPVALPARFPILLAQGTEGIAVGLTSKILPHNFVEICQAACAYLRGEDFQLYPDFPTGGYIDVSRYNDGERKGRIKSRAKIDKIDNRVLSISELPAGKTTTSLIDSILSAESKGKIRIKRIDNMTASSADIRITLPAGVSSDKAIDSLYAFTDCEVSISPNCCVIYDQKPLFTTISEILRYSTERTKKLFDKELRTKLLELQNRYLLASLERLFIQERIYKDKEFEDAKSEEEALDHVALRLEPFTQNFIRPITQEDLKHLLEIRMARILKFNLPKHEAQMLALESEIKQIKHNLKNLVNYTIRWYEHLINRYGDKYPRKTKITNFETIEANKVAELDNKLYINREEGFIGTGLKDAEFVCQCSDLDDIILFYQSGKYQVFKVENKRFFGQEEVIHIDRYTKGDDRTTYNVVYLDGASGNSYIKRFQVKSLIRERLYDLTRGEKKSKVLYFTANGNGEAEVINVGLKMLNKRQKRFSFEKDFSEIPIKGRSTVGYILTKGKISSIRQTSKGVSTLGGRDVWFDPDVKRLNYNDQGEYLGEFFAEDRLFVVLEDKRCYTTDFSDTNHFDSKPIVLEKLNTEKVWTAVYWDEEQGYHYIKRFTIEEDQKIEPIVGEAEANKLMLLTDNYYARLLINKKGEKDPSKATEIDCDDFATIKSIRAKGRRLANYPLGTITELEPLKPNPYKEKEEELSDEEEEQDEADLFGDQNTEADD